MCQILKFILVLQVFLCNCSIYYDVEEWEESEPKARRFPVQYGNNIEEGVVAAPQLVNFLISIRTTRPTRFFGDNHYCSGTIIGLDMVVTAAHCLVDSRRVVTRARRLTIVAGTPNRLHHNHNTVQIRVDRVIPHPEFNRRGPHDIALLILKNQIPFNNPSVRIASLIKRSPQVGTPCIMMGWGDLLVHGPHAAQAQYLPMRVLDDSFCKTVFKSRYHPNLHICGMDLSTLEKGACRGDSGGPLFCTERLAGIITYGIGCHIKSGPTVFTDIEVYRQWIQDFKNTQNRKRISTILLVVGNFIAIFASIERFPFEL